MVNGFAKTELKDDETLLPIPEVKIDHPFEQDIKDQMEVAKVRLQEIESY